jgi:hypothetical protein
MEQHPERRQRRSSDPLRALRLQLDACRVDAAIDAMVISDESGLCLAASGSFHTCGEVAAQLPLVANDIDYFEGTVSATDESWDVALRRVEVLGTPLFVCAVGGAGLRRARQLDRSVGGMARILAA